jgi:hypothetical protein
VIARLLTQTLLWIGAMALLLLVPAGTLHWPPPGHFWPP